MQPHKTVMLVIGMCLFGSSLTIAANIETPTFPKTLTLTSRESNDGEPNIFTLRCNGIGLCEWGILRIDLYKAALYLEQPSATARTVIESNQVKQIRLHFLRSLTQKQMQRAYRASFEMNAERDLDRCRQRIDRFIRLIPGVKKGDCLTFTSLPTRGLEIRLGSRLLGRIPGDDFGRLFVRLYVGAIPPTPKVRQGLLGLAKNP